MRTSILALAMFPGLALASPLTADGVLEDAPGHEPLAIAPWADEAVSAGIVGGSETSEFDNVLVVVAYFGSNQGFDFCSATQISDDVAITAAHCAEAGEDYIDQGATLYLARTDNLYETAQDGWFDVEDGGVFIHPQWDGTNQNNVINDVALLRTRIPIVTTDGPAVLNDEPIDNSWIGRELRFVGFGITDDGARDSGIKRTTAIPAEDFEFGIVYSYDPNTNVCSGDSGGAAFEQTPEGLELAGVNSFVQQISWEGDPCDGGRNGAARVDSYIDWILSIEPDARTEWDLAEDPEDPNDPNGGDGVDPNDPSGGADPADVTLAPGGCACSTGPAPQSGLMALLALPLLLSRRKRS